MDDATTGNGRAARWDVAPGDALYPEALAATGYSRDLHVLGDAGALDTERSVAVLGARRATPYGTAVSRMVGTVVAEEGLTLVTGMARGCDASAAEAALEAGGRVVLLAGCGPDVSYPKGLEATRDRALAAGGAVVSLEPWGTPPTRAGFLRKNHAAAALCDTLVIAQACLPSSAFSVGDEALGLGVDVLAVPGSVFEPASRGCNELVAHGARAVTCEAMLRAHLEEAFGLVPSQAVTHGGPPLPPLERALAEDPLTTEQVARLMEARVGSPAPLEALERLTDLEAEGRVTRLADGRWSATTDAIIVGSHHRGR